MASNGDGTTRQLEQLEAAITGPRPTPQGPAEELAIDLLRLAEAQAERKRAAGRYALEHGQYLHDICEAHAKRSLSNEQEFAKNLMAAERRKMDELSRIFGELENK